MLVPYSERGSVPVEVVVSQFEDVFGALRSLYASGVPAADALWELMNSAHELDTARYHDQLAPYLEAHDLPEPLCTVRTLAELRAAVALAPFARFALASRPEGSERLDLEALVDSPEARALVGLSLSDEEVDLVGLWTLGMSEHVAGLRSLRVAYAEVGVDGAIALAQSEGLVGLRRLELYASDIEDEGAAALASSTSLALESLALRFCAVGDAGVVALADAALMGNLVELDLSSNELGNAAARALARSERVSRLEALRLGSTSIGDPGVSEIASSSSLSRLEVLALNGCRVRNRGASALARGRVTSQLRELDLSNNQIGDEGASAFASSPRVRSLRELHLGYNRITRRGFDELRASENLAEATVSGEPVGGRQS